MLYTANGFVEKNAETLSTELKNLGSHSTNNLSREIFLFSMKEEASASVDTVTRARKKGSGLRGVSVASQIIPPKFGCGP